VTFFRFGVAFLILVFAQMFTESPFGDSATPDVHALVIVGIQKALIGSSRNQLFHVYYRWMHASYL